MCSKTFLHHPFRAGPQDGTAAWRRLAARSEIRRLARTAAQGWRRHHFYRRDGKDLTDRFSFVRDSIAALPASSAIIDAELVACDDDGKPDFGALMARTSNSGNVCAWCFDLLAHNGRDFRPLPLVKRKDMLRDILNAADDDTLRYADEFPDPEKLLAAIESMGLEGMVSKLVEQPYRSGKNPGWVKVKSKAWRAANRDRLVLFGSAKWRIQNVVE
jgi:ATP-dependent DNA ligase